MDMRSSAEALRVVMITLPEYTTNHHLEPVSLQGYITLRETMELRCGSQDQWVNC